MEIEPPRSAERLKVYRFEIEESRSGDVIRKTLNPTDFVLSAVCTSPKSELKP